MRVNTQNEISTMDLSNLSDDQLTLIKQLVVAAENGFDFLAAQAEERAAIHQKESITFRSVEMKNIKQANKCMVLRNRIGREIRERALDVSIDAAITEWRTK